MCGITGYWSRGGRGLPAATFQAFTRSLAHRGPDGLGVQSFGGDGLWLGHTRLAIIDLSERGHQPMAYGDGRYWLTFNGEIYNHVELRETLRGLGHRFGSTSDSEVILAAYAEWGPACQLRFNGMWAFAIWDDREKQLFLSRDRFGIKPLHYAETQGAFAFASELKSFLQLDGFDGCFDPGLLAETLDNTLSQEATPHTLLAGVRRLPGGHCMTVTATGIQVVRWWNTLDHLPVPPAGLDDQAEQFRQVFLDACRLRRRSDVPVATSLSGGLDSSAVVCAIAELARRGAVDHVPRDWQRVFVACFPGTRLDERPYAEQVVAHTGVQAQFCPVDDGLAASRIEQVIFDLEGIFPVPLVGAWAIYREMRGSGIRVSLDGHGADELLGGYHHFVNQAILELLGPAFRPRRYLDLRRVREGMSDATDIAGSGARVGSVPISGDLRAAWSYYAGRVRSRLGAPRPAPAGFVAVPGPHRLRAVSDANQPARWGALRRMQYAWFHQGLLPTFLRNIDRASMAHGIEVRMPFLDWRVATLGFALPDESLIGGGYTKRILRLAMQGLMPDAIRLRTNKFHFSSPISEWARGGLRSWLLDLASSRSFVEAAAWDGPRARGAIERAIAGGAELNPVWPIINAHVLQQGFREAARQRGEMARRASENLTPLPA